jgi:hypothetical protein
MGHNVQAGEWITLARRAWEAAAGCPPLPSYAVVREGERERWFAELGYTFWCRELVDSLARRLRTLGPARWVELAPGTGRLSAELARRGVSIVATDSYGQAAERVRSFQRVIRYGEWVVRMDAREAVSRLRPDGVLCAWPPLGSGLVPELLHDRMPGTKQVRAVVAIGEPGGATEMPDTPEELPDGWRMEHWPECERYLAGFNDPVGETGSGSNSVLRVYLRR